jgi:hypothetical protein
MKTVTQKIRVRRGFLVMMMEVFQESEVVGLLEWVEGEAKTHHWIVHSFYQMATNWMWWVGIVLLFYQMAKYLLVCF